MADRQYVRSGNGLSNKDIPARERVQEARAKARKAAQLENRVDALEREVEELKKLIHGNQV